MATSTAGRSSLAIHGSPPVRTAKMPNRQAFGDAEVAMLTSAIEYYRSRDEDPPYQGRFEKQLCEEFATFMGGGYADAVCSGTVSVFVALKALEPPAGSEVIISPVTDSGPLNCIIMQGLVPVVADAAPGSYNINTESFLARVSPKTSVLLAVHSAGQPLEIDRIVAAAHQRGIKVLEDVSQAPGALCQGKRVGSFGDIAAFSTMYRKSLTAGASGGLVFTRDEALYRKALTHADRGKPVWRTDLDLRNPEHSFGPALNFNTDEFSSAIGIASLRRLQETIDRRNDFLEAFCQKLSEQSRVCRPYPFHRGFSPFYFPVFVDRSRISCSKDEFASAVAAEGIGLLPRYGCLVAGWPWARQYMRDDFHTPNAFETRESSFNMFLNERYGRQEVDDTIAAIRKVEEHYVK